MLEMPYCAEVWSFQPGSVTPPAARGEDIWWAPHGDQHASSNPASAGTVLTDASRHCPAHCLVLHIGGSSNYQKIVANHPMFAWRSFWTKNTVQLILSSSCTSVTEDTVPYQSPLSHDERRKTLHVPKLIAHSYYYSFTYLHTERPIYP